MVAFLCTTPAAWAQVTVRVDPRASTWALGEQFTVEIVADMTQPVLGWGVDVTISDPAVVSLVGQPTIDAQWVPMFALDGDGLAGAAFPNSISGNGLLLATLTLSADSIGETAVTVSITASDLTEGFPLDPSAYAEIIYESGLVVVSSALPPSCNDDIDCDDGLFCNGEEVCDVSNICQFGTPPCHDAVECTDDACDEVNDVCSNVSNDGRCDDGFFCNGAETCDAQLGCLAGADPCPLFCNQASETCIDCLDDADCDDGSLCTGYETCDEFGFCSAGIPLDCDDGDICTGDSCNPVGGCVNTPLVPCCGNQVVEQGEECDPPDGQTCDINCMFPICPGEGGPCDEDNGTPGCDCVQCCVWVCAGDPFCCGQDPDGKGYWDGTCASASGPNCPPSCTLPTQTIMYVDPSAAAGQNDGTDWPNAFLDLQDALARSGCCNATPVEEIWVAQGTYVPSDCAVGPEGCTEDDRLETFQLVSGVRILGGFPSSGVGERDPDAYETTLSGDLIGDDVGGVQDSSRVENSVRVVTGTDTDETAVLDGFTITGGNADLCIPSFGPCFTSGAGILIGGGSPTIANCRINSNYAAVSGGGVYVSGGPTLVSCEFTGNETGINGGGIRAGGGTNLIQCRFEGNTANGDVLEGRGGAVYVPGSADLTAINCEFIGNSATYLGGGLFCDRNGSWTGVNCLFANNSASSGGAVFNMSNTTQTIINCTLSGNEALSSSSGGGIQGGGKFSEPMEIHNTILWGNIANGATDEAAQIAGSYINVTHSCIQDDNPDDGYIPFGAAANNIDDNPQFVDPLGVPGIFDPDLRLRPCSPCIETGDNDVLPPDLFDLDGDDDTLEEIPYDLDGTPRVIDTDGDGVPIVDMGAYEHMTSDCDSDGVLDECEANDCNANGVADECDPDCQPNGIPDDCDIASGWSLDENGNGVPDECELELVVVEVEDATAEQLGLKVCDVYLQFDPPDVEALLSVTDTYITSTDPFQGFWHHSSGGDTAPSASLCAADPEVCIDSFVTIGVLVNDGSDATTLDGDFNTIQFNSNGQVVGGWYNSNPSNAQGAPDLWVSRTLIARLTVRAKDGYGVSGDLTVTLGDGSSIPGLHFECFCITCPEDFDCDHEVGSNDLALLLGSWGPCVDCVADLDHSGDVGPFDLALLLGAWGLCPQPPEANWNGAPDDQRFALSGGNGCLPLEEAVQMMGYNDVGEFIAWVLSAVPPEAVYYAAQFLLWLMNNWPC